MEMVVCGKVRGLGLGLSLRIKRKRDKQRGYISLALMMCKEIRRVVGSDISGTLMLSASKPEPEDDDIC
jgi:hypothetical protein